MIQLHFSLEMAGGLEERGTPRNVPEHVILSYTHTHTHRFFWLTIQINQNGHIKTISETDASDKKNVTITRDRKK